MNYRHHFHAGNYADVMKHALLVLLIRGLQRKEKGFLYLDTHAGRGGYDLRAAARGDSLERRPEWPEGIGRLTMAEKLGPLLSDYLALVRSYASTQASADPNSKIENPESKIPLSHYPGSPWIAKKLLRPLDRVALCEKHPEEFAALAEEMSGLRGVSLHELDGYTALRAMLPPPERRALVLIDPPYEAEDEFASIVGALREGLGRMPAATFAIWYPLTERARIASFVQELEALQLPASWAAELEIAGADAGLKMNGCGLLVVNPPWQLDQEVGPLLKELCPLLAQGPGATSRLVWLVHE